MQAWQALLEEKTFHYLLRKENIGVITLSIAGLFSGSLVRALTMNHELFMTLKLARKSQDDCEV